MTTQDAGQRPTAEEARARVMEFLRESKPPLLVTDENARTATLLEPASGKALRLHFGAIARLEVKTSKQRPAPYLSLLIETGDGEPRSLALADVGFAFAPDTRSSGPLAELPQAFSFGDFRHLLFVIESLQQHEGRQAESARLFLFLLALIDGARAVGFDVSTEEKTLEALLVRMEA